MINWDQVNELRSEVGPEDFDEVISLFLEEVQEVIDDLRDNTSDGAQLEQKMHFLKGSASSLGFDAFSLMCADGEKSAAAGRSEEVDVSAVVHCYSSSRDAFLRDIKSRCT